jgi:nanoRNase/pAp phosphatase (c-di-AMP/oligoRNAs hydrolase)
MACDSNGRRKDEWQGRPLPGGERFRQLLAPESEQNVHTTIVYGLVIEGGREMIIGSLRTKKATLNPDAFLKEALGGPQAGRYYGGGRREAGGFEIPIGFLAGSYDDEFMRWKWRLYDEQVKRKLWARMGVEKLRQPRG